MYELLKRTLYDGIFYSGFILKYLTSRKFKSENTGRILVIAIGEIGDVLRLFPFLSALRKKFPDTFLGILTTLPENHDVWGLLPESIKIDKKILFDMIAVHHSVPSKLKLIYDLRREGYDVTIDTSRGHGMAPNSIMTFLIGSPHRIGFQKGGIGSLHTIRVPLSDDEYIGDQNLKLLKAMGITAESAEIKLNLPSMKQEFSDLFSMFRAPVIAIHPGARWHGRQRCWPPQRYAELSKKIIMEYNATIILLGDMTEKDLTMSISNEVKHPSLFDISGRTSLVDAVQIINHSDLFIGNDSSLLHLAVALKKPAVGIFGPTSPKQVLPHNPDCYVIRQNFPCSPCYTHQPLFNRECAHRECMLTLPAEKVMDAVRLMLGKPCTV